jgi:hypothetical protein
VLREGWTRTQDVRISKSAFFHCASSLCIEYYFLLKIWEKNLFTAEENEGEKYPREKEAACGNVLKLFSSSLMT